MEDKLYKTIDREKVIRRTADTIIEAGGASRMERATGIKKNVWKDLLDTGKMLNTHCMYVLCKYTQTPLVWMLGLTDQYPEYEYVRRNYNTSRVSDRFEAAIDKFYRTPYQTGKAIGYSDTAIQHVITDGRISLDMLYRFCYVTRVSPDWLVGLIDHRDESQRVIGV